MKKNDKLFEELQHAFASECESINFKHHEINIVVSAENLEKLLVNLKEQKLFAFDQLIDLCVVDYLYFGKYDWETNSATESGFSRGVEAQECTENLPHTPRFAVVYHLLSTTHNQRIRVKVFVDEKNPVVRSVTDIWRSASWFEREAYDLYGVLFDGHPDLRRILTDYGFIGHPFRKDFPLSGNVEMRYDATLQKVIYEPVDIEPRILVPKVIRDDNRYLTDSEGEQ